MTNKITLFLIGLMTVFAMGCGDSNDDLVFNGNQNNNGNVVAGTTFLRLAHLVPAGQNYDVLVNDQVVLSNLTFGQFTDYLAVATNARIRVTQAGNEDIVLIDRTLNAGNGTYATLALAGTPGPGNVLATTYADAVAQAENLSSIRLVNGSQDNLTISLFRTDDTLIVGSITYPNATNYAQVQPGTYNLEVRDSNNVVVASVNDVTLNAGANYSAFFFGDAGTSTQNVLIVADLTTQGIPGNNP